MLTSDQIILFTAATAALAFSPGPNHAYMLSRTLTYGRKAGIVCLLGVESGFFVHLLAAAFGLTAFLLAVPLAYDALRLVGAGYLIYLAWNTIRRGHDEIGIHSLSRAESSRRLFRLGFVSNALNPKTAVFYLSVFPQFVDPVQGSVFGQSVVLGLVHIAVSTACNLLLILSVGLTAALFRKGSAWGIVRRWLFGSILAGFALRLVLEERR